MIKSLPVYATFNLAKARQEMAESTYPHGFTLDFNIWPLFANIAQVVAADLSKIGITLNIKPESESGWVALVAGGDRPAIGLQICSPGTNDPDPSYIPSFIMGSKNAVAGAFNIANYTPASVDALIARGTQIPNGPRRLAIYGKILKAIATDVPYIPLSQNENSAILSKKFDAPNFLGDIAGYLPWPLYVRAR
jgi:ABC-type transport system substrate-binding protein